MTTVAASVHRLRSWAVAVALLLSTLVAGVPPTSMEWPGSQALCADVAVTVAVNPDHAPTADLLHYRITAGHSHGPPVAINGPAPGWHTYYVLAGETPVLVHNAGGDDGYVYLRVDLATGDQYVGQAMNTDRYNARQAEHARANPNAKFEFHVLGRAPAGVQLDVLEESWIRAGGGPKTSYNPNGTLVNKRFQMSDIRYLAAGGSICK